MPPEPRPLPRRRPPLAASGRSIPALLLGPFAALSAALAAPALAHEMLHEIARGRAIAVKASQANGEPLANATYEVYSPAEPGNPHQKGRTDRGGWLAFVPDAPGPWRVRVLERSGHGLDLRVDADADLSAAGPAGTGTGTVTAATPGPAPATGALSSTAFVLRPLAGLLVIAAAFTALALTYRRKGRTP